MALFEHAGLYRSSSGHHGKLQPVAVGCALFLHALVLSSLALLPLPDVARVAKPSTPRVLYLTDALMVPLAPVSTLPLSSSSTPEAASASSEPASVPAPVPVAMQVKEPPPMRPMVAVRPGTSAKLEPVVQPLPPAMPVVSASAPDKRVDVVANKTVPAPLPSPVVMPTSSTAAAPAVTVAAVPTVRELPAEAAAPKPPPAPVGETRPPRELRRVVPTIPSMARAQKLSGTVLVRVTVKDDGSVEELKVIQSPSPLLDQAAVDAARRMTFEPALSGGKPVRGSVDVPFIFRLK